MTTEQLTLLQGDVLAQHRFVLQAILGDALRLLTQPDASRPDGWDPVEAHALRVIRETAAELRSLPGEDAVPF